METDIELEIWKFLTKQLMDESKESGQDWHKRLGKELPQEPVAEIEIEVEPELEGEEVVSEEETDLPNYDPADDPEAAFKNRIKGLRTNKAD